MIFDDFNKTRKTAESQAYQGFQRFFRYLRILENSTIMPQTGDCGVDISTFSSVLCDICASNLCITIS
jgi:hypothetical protein